MSRPIQVGAAARRGMDALARGVAVDGCLLAAVATRHRRLWPPNSGDGTFVETVSVSADLSARVNRLLELLPWRGVFQLELIEHEGRFAALDFNPRPYGSMGIAQAAGAPLSSLWCSWALLLAHGLQLMTAAAKKSHR